MGPHDLLKQAEARAKDLEEEEAAINRIAMKRLKENPEIATKSGYRAVTTTTKPNPREKEEKKAPFKEPYPVDPELEKLKEEHRSKFAYKVVDGRQYMEMGNRIRDLPQTEQQAIKAQALDYGENNKGYYRKVADLWKAALGIKDDDKKRKASSAWMTSPK